MLNPQTQKSPTKLIIKSGNQIRATVRKYLFHFYFQYMHSYIHPALTITFSLYCNSKTERQGPESLAGVRNPDEMRRGPFLFALLLPTEPPSAATCSEAPPLRFAQEVSRCLATREIVRLQWESCSVRSLPFFSEAELRSEFSCQENFWKPVQIEVGANDAVCPSPAPPYTMPPIDRSCSHIPAPLPGTQDSQPGPLTAAPIQVSFACQPLASE